MDQLIVSPLQFGFCQTVIELWLEYAGELVEQFRLFVVWWQTASITLGGLGLKHVTSASGHFNVTLLRKQADEGQRQAEERL